MGTSPPPGQNATFPTVTPGNITFPAWIVEAAAGYGVRQVSSQADVTLAEALDWPWPVYVFQTQAEADKFAKSQGNNAAGKAKPGQSTIGPGVGPNAATANAGNAAAGTFIGGVSDFFGALGQGNTWLRVLEVGLGVVLICVGLARITDAVPIATKVASAAANPGSLLK